jgi:hypothetical protein
VNPITGPLFSQKQFRIIFGLGYSLGNFSQQNSGRPVSRIFPLKFVRLEIQCGEAFFAQSTELHNQLIRSGKANISFVFEIAESGKVWRQNKTKQNISFVFLMT